MFELDEDAIERHSVVSQEGAHELGSVADHKRSMILDKKTAVSVSCVKNSNSKFLGNTNDVK